MARPILPGTRVRRLTNNIPQRLHVGTIGVVREVIPRRNGDDGRDYPDDIQVEWQVRDRPWTIVSTSDVEVV